MTDGETPPPRAAGPYALAGGPRPRLTRSKPRHISVVLADYLLGHGAPEHLFPSPHMETDRSEDTARSTTGVRRNLHGRPDEPPEAHSHGATRDP